MNNLLSLVIFLLVFGLVCWPETDAKSQSFYFPPTTGTQWDTLSTVSLGWNDQKVDSLYQFLETQNTKAFLILKDGKIVLEKYFGTFSMDSAWYWASAGKSMTAFLTGIAQEEGHFSIADTTSQYLGTGWTSLAPQQEAAITIEHQLTMTTGLDDWTGNPDCTFDSCLVYRADPGARWAYHNAPYSLISSVIESATGHTYNQYTYNKLTPKTGITGFWIAFGFDRVFFSKPRTMARYGLLVLNGCVWDGDTLLHDQSYLQQMTNTSQNLNKSYGYLWWLNGQESHMLPVLQTVFPGWITPNAPEDMYAAMGKNGQLLNIVPSENIVVVRMGNNPDNSFVPAAFQDSMWYWINRVMTSPTTGILNELEKLIEVFPNPAAEKIYIKVPTEVPIHLRVFDVVGKEMINSMISKTKTEVDVGGWNPGIYILNLEYEIHQYTRKVIVQ